MAERPWELKLARAQELIIELSNDVGAYLREADVRLDSRPVGGAHADWDLFIRFSFSPPARVSSLVGDVLHNLRSALDAYAFHVLTTEGGATAEEQHRLAFPITGSRADFVGGRWRPKALPTRVEEAFVRVQPWRIFEGVAVDDLEDSIANVPLVRLAELNNIDKHRTVHVSVCFLKHMWAGVPEGTSSVWLVGDPWPWGDGSRVARLRVSGLQPGTGPGFGSNFDVALEGDAEELGGWGLHDRLSSLHGAVRSAIAEVEQILQTS